MFKGTVSFSVVDAASKTKCTIGGSEGHPGGMKKDKRGQRGKVEKRRRREGGGKRLWSWER